MILPGGPDGVNLTALLECLSEKGIKRLMVEGGAGVITSFLKEKLVDLLVITITPVLLGGLSLAHGFSQPASGSR